MKEFKIKKISSSSKKSSAQVIRVSDGKEMLIQEFWLAAAKRACDYLNGKDGASNEAWMIAK